MTIPRDLTSDQLKRLAWLLEHPEYYDREERLGIMCEGGAMSEREAVEEMERRKNEK